jgi:hypothetical protein
MIHLKLDDLEAQILSDVLAYDLAELGSEIRHTDGHDYREGLKSKQSTLKRLLAQLDAAAAA